MICRWGDIAVFETATLQYIYVKIGFHSNFLESSQHGGLSPTKTPMMHSDVQALQWGIEWGIGGGHMGNVLERTPCR